MNFDFTATQRRLTLLWQVVDHLLNLKNYLGLCSVKPSLSHTAFGKSQDGSSLLGTALANERAKTNTWGNNNLTKCFLCPCLFCLLSVVMLPVTFLLNLLLFLQFLSTGMAAHTRSCTSKHISSHMASSSCMQQSILQSWLNDCGFLRLCALKDSLWTHQTHFFHTFESYWGLHLMKRSIRVKTSITNITA